MRLRGFVAAGALFFATGGCQLVFGLGDFSEGEPGSGTGGSGGSGSGGSVSTITSTTTDGGGGTGCGCLDPVWTPVTLVAQGDPAVDPLPTGCPTAGEVLNLFQGAPAVECTACSCSATCNIPSITCYTDANCTQGAKTMTPSPGSCYDGGATFESCKLDTALTVTSCDTTGGEPVQAYAFAKYESLCPDAACAACTPGAEQACVVAAGNIPACPAGLDQRTLLYASGEAGCAACSCEGSCPRPYELEYDIDIFCVGDGPDIASTGCTSVGGRKRVSSSAGASSCTTESGAHVGTFTTSEPYTVCCRDPLAPPG